MNKSYRIAIHNALEIDTLIARQLLDLYSPSITLANGESDYDLDIERFTSPIRAGLIIDTIENGIFNKTFRNIDPYKNYSLDWDQSILMISDKVITLSERERDVLALLIKSGDDGCSRQMLLQKIWGYQSGTDTHALETHIYRLRHKIEKNPENPVHIVTIEDGYKLK